MGAGGRQNRGKGVSYERNLKLIDKQNYRVDRYKNGEKVQSRWYDESGKAIRNRDYIHQNSLNNHSFPHDHTWSWEGDKASRGTTPLSPDYINYPDINE